MEAGRHTHTNTHTLSGGEMDRMTHSSGTSHLPPFSPPKTLSPSPASSRPPHTCHWGSLANPASPLRSGSSFFRHFPKRGEAETRPCQAGACRSAPPLALGAACSVWPQRQIAPEDGPGTAGRTPSVLGACLNEG